MKKKYDKTKLKNVIKGAPKNDAAEAKPDLSLLPLNLLSWLARAYEYGCWKYFRNSWRRGFRTNRTIAAAQRHISEWQDLGQKYDKDAYELAGMKIHHIAMAIFSLVCVLDSETNHPELVENYVPPKFKSDVPLDDLEKLQYEARRLLWLYNEDPIEFQEKMTPEEIIKKFKK